MNTDLTRKIELSLIGLGAMGAPLARNILAKGQALTVWNRTSKKSAEFADLGATIANSPAEAAAAVVMTVLPDIGEVRSVLEGESGLLAGWAAAGVRKPILVIMGTVSAAAVTGLQDELAEHGVWVVDAPLSGGTVGAEAGTLSIMVGADPALFQLLKPYFELVGSTVLNMGKLGTGQLTKACNQLVVAASISAISEAMLLARESGIDKGLLREALLGGLAASALLDKKGHHWISEEFGAGGMARYQLKDLNFVRDQAQLLGLKLPVTESTRQLFSDMIEHGMGDLDHTGVFLEIERRSKRD